MNDIADAFNRIRYARDLPMLRAGAAHAVEQGTPVMLLDYLQETGHPLAPIAAAAAATKPGSLREWGRTRKDRRPDYTRYTERLTHYPDGDPKRGIPEYTLTVFNPHSLIIPRKTTYRAEVTIPTGRRPDADGISFWASLSPAGYKAALEHIRDHADTHADTKLGAGHRLFRLAHRHPELQEGR